MRLIESFVLTLDSSEGSADSSDVSWYASIFINTKQFQFVAQYWVSGLLFHQEAQMMLDLKGLLGIGIIGYCYEGIFSRYSHFICEMILQCAVELLHNIRALSVAIDTAMNMVTN